MNPDADLYQRVKGALIRSLATTDLTMSDIDTDADLFGEAGLGLDSVDALEFAFEIEEEFGVRIPDDDAHRQVFSSIRAMARYLTDAAPGLTESPDPAG
jgi:acyl carrier protein